MFYEYPLRISHNVEELGSVASFTNDHTNKRLQEKECGEIGLFSGA